MGRNGATHRALAVWFVSGTVALSCVTPDAMAQAAAKAYRIGWLGNGIPSSGEGPLGADFQQGLRDLGYVVGQNVVVEVRNGEGNVDRLPQLVAELTRLPVDVIVTSGDAAALAAKRASASTPIVTTEISIDPVKAGLVESLGRPGGNVTGLAGIGEGLWQKRLGLLKEIEPRIVRLAALWNPANPGNSACVEELKAAAPGMGVQLRALEVRDARTIDQAFANLSKQPTDAIAICWDGVTIAQARAIADFALARRMATVAPLREYAVAGALLSLGESLPAQRRRAAYYVSKILKGAKPSDLPIERPTLFELVLNLKTVKALGLALPPNVALLADDVLE